MIAIAYLKIKGYDLNNTNILVAFGIEFLALGALSVGLDLLRHSL